MLLVARIERQALADQQIVTLIRVNGGEAEPVTVEDAINLAWGRLCAEPQGTHLTLLKELGVA